MSDRTVQALAREAGILVDWEDAAGRQQTVAPESLQAILAALELPAGSEAEARESRERLARSRAASSLITADAGRPFRLPHAAPARLARLHLESGETRDLPLTSQGGGVAARIDVPGYHRIELDGRELRLAIAPTRAFAVEDAAPGRRIWGPAVQLYSLRSRRPRPYGDFGALAEFAAEAAAQGADAVAISPVHALFAADPDRFGPYGPSTRLFLNVAYADPAAVFGEELRSAGSDGGDLIDWPAATPSRLGVLAELFDGFANDPHHPRRADFQAFMRERGDDLTGHARFEALHAHFRAQDGATGWQVWPTAYQDPASPAVAAFAREHARAVEFHLFLQWLADRSLARAQAAAVDAGMALGLITDVAVGMDAGGSHAWSRPDDLLKALSIGAPPDMFQARGQDWGITTFSPEGLARSGFAPFVDTLRAAMRHAGGVRIDHAMGLRRLWVVPHGAEPTQGAYLTYPQEDLMRLVALESQRQRAVVVAEDLGTVPPGFRDELSSRAIMGMRVLWFERQEGGGFLPASAYAAEAAAMTSTHDLPTVAGWWRGRDLDWAERIRPDPSTVAADRQERAAHRELFWRACVAAGAAEGPPPPEDEPAPVVDAACAFVSAAPARLALLPIEDLLGLEEQPNLPGTIDEHPNWRRRLPADAQSLFGELTVRTRLQQIDRRRR